MMDLPEKLWYAMHGVDTAASREKHPNMLRDLGKIANHSLAVHSFPFFLYSTQTDTQTSFASVSFVRLCPILWKSSCQQSLS